jgi:prepilin-type processing-associated H-X9-DG protein
MWSWIARTLPYMEQNNLYNQAGIDTASLRTSLSPQAINPAISTPIKSLFCPSDKAMAVGTLSNRANFPALPVGLTNYKGVSGSNHDSRTGNGPQNAGGVNQWVVNTPGPTGANSANGLRLGNGLFFRDDIKFKFRITDIKDGTSNTFMIGEDIPEMNTHCSWPYSNNAIGNCAIPPNTVVLAQYRNGAVFNGQPVTGFAPGDWPQVYSFRSQHPGGLQFALADGSVRFVRDNIDLATYRAMASMSLGEVNQLN